MIGPSDFDELADRVRLDLALLGYDPQETDPDLRATTLRHARLLAGLLWRAGSDLVELLAEDLVVVATTDPQEIEQVVAESAVLVGLPPQFHSRITPRFVTRFLAVTVDLTMRLARGWQPLDCIAGELALRGLLDQVAITAARHRIDLPEQWRAVLEDWLFEDLKHEHLYDEDFDPDQLSFDEIEPAPMVFETGATMRFEDWFVPFRNGEAAVPPVAVD